MPAFVGLGAPHWSPDARGAVFGLSRATGAAELARAALQSVTYQTCDLLEAIAADWPNATPTILRVDGGMVASDWMLQDLADMLDMSVDRPTILETTALGRLGLPAITPGCCRISPVSRSFGGSTAVLRRTFLSWSASAVSPRGKRL